MTEQTKPEHTNPEQTSREKATYYINVPALVRYDKNIPYGARLLYGEIAALAGSSGVCWASNNYFANQYDVSRQCISEWLLALQRQGYISKKTINKPGSKEVARREIMLTDHVQRSAGGGTKDESPVRPDAAELAGVSSQYSRPSAGKTADPLQPKAADNNIKLNTIKQNNNKHIREAPDAKTRREQDQKQAARQELAAVLESFELPAEVKTELVEFIKMRQEGKKPLTAHALRLTIQKLLELAALPEQQQAIVQQTIMNGWQTFYPLRTAYAVPADRQQQDYNKNNSKEWFTNDKGQKIKRLSGDYYG